MTPMFVYIQGSLGLLTEPFADYLKRVSYLSKLRQVDCYHLVKSFIFATSHRYFSFQPPLLFTVVFPSPVFLKVPVGQPHEFHICYKKSSLNLIILS